MAYSNQHLYQSGANQAASQGIQTILAGLGGTAKALQQGTKDEEEREKLKFQQAIQLVGLRQNQQKIDNQDSQAGAVLAQGDRRMSLQQGQFESAQAFKERQQSKQYQQQLALQQGQQSFQSKEKGLDRDFKKDIQQSGFKQQTAMQKAGFVHSDDQLDSKQVHQAIMQDDAQSHNSSQAGLDRKLREDMQLAGFIQQDNTQATGHTQAIERDNNQATNRLVLQDDAQAHNGEVAAATVDKQIQLEKAKQRREKAKIILQGKVDAQVNKAKGTGGKKGKNSVNVTGQVDKFIEASSDLSEDGQKNLRATVDLAVGQGLPLHTVNDFMTFLHHSGWAIDGEGNIANMSGKQKQDVIDRYVTENPQFIQNKSASTKLQNSEVTPEVAELRKVLGLDL